MIPDGYYKATIQPMNGNGGCTAVGEVIDGIYFANVGMRDKVELWIEEGWVFTRLVPVDELKAAFEEGMLVVAANLGSVPPDPPMRYDTSRTRRLVEGTR